MHLGLGQIKQLDSLKILWPSGITDLFLNLETNQFLSIKEGSTNRFEPGNETSEKMALFRGAW